MSTGTLYNSLPLTTGAASLGDATITDATPTLTFKDSSCH